MGKPPGLRLARIRIDRYATEDGEMLDYIDALDGEGDELDLATALGMMRLAEDTLIHGRYEDSDD